MNNLDWELIRHLTPGEFSENPRFAEPQLIYGLDFIRDRTQECMFPSPIKGALARWYGSSGSQHFAEGRLSTASDVFCEGLPISNYHVIHSTNIFRGIGIYLDTTGPDGFPWVMLHLDIRPQGFAPGQPLIWFVKKVFDVDNGVYKDKYYYPQSNPQYWRLFQDNKLYTQKKYIKGDT